jgi:ATP-binding cassette, subfamily F, member 3
MAPVTILSVTELQKYFGSESVFDSVTFQLAERERVALVGINGAGKSTLLRIIAGIEDASAGTVTTARGLRVTYLPQEARFTSTRSVLEEATLAFEPVMRDAERMREIEQMLADTGRSDFDALLEEYAHLQHRFEVRGGFEMEHRTEQILAGLGFSEDQYDEPVRQLSGGQRTRVALAKALLGDPDLLLLDEPTNHLDLEMLAWLEEFLLGWGGACLVVSHDRYFLDRVTIRTLDLSFGRIEDYPAGYSGYVRLRGERMERWGKEYEAQQEFIAQTEEFIRKYKAGQRAREARGRQTRLDRLERIPRPQAHDELRISIAPAQRSGDVVVRTSSLKVGYRNNDDGSESLLVTTPELTVNRGDRIGIIGPNGEGKTTLLRTLIGDLPMLKGTIEYGVNVTIGYYAQAHEQLPLDGTPLSVILDAQPLGEESARNYLGRFLFSGDDALKPVSSLSGGERSRLALAMLLLRRANVLILDEPTNHLDVYAREALEQMLTGFDGTILFVSHDRYFVDRLANQIWSIEQGTVHRSLGNFSDFMRARGSGLSGLPAQPAQHRQEQKSEPKHDGRNTHEQASRDGRHKAGEGQRRKSIERIEREISRLEKTLNAVGDALAIAEVDQHYEEMARLSEKHNATEESLERAYEEWEALQDEATAASVSS